MVSFFKIQKIGHIVIIITSVTQIKIGIADKHTIPAKSILTSFVKLIIQKIHMANSVDFPTLDGTFISHFVF